MNSKNAFLASEFPPAPAATAAFHIIPAPMELSVSYGGGAHRGPQAIIDASQQLEVCDGEGRASAANIHTQKPVAPRSKKPEDWIDAVEARVALALACRAVPVILGGEHTVTLGAARAFHRAGAKIGFIHVDAHADLRDRYEGNPFSHACVMRRVHELGFPCLQIATRAVAQEERNYRAANPKTITAYDAREIADGKMPQHFIPRAFPKKVYVTFDVDGFDPAVMPATGTPVPGGLFWHDAIHLLREVATQGRIAGFDVVELAPLRSLPHADFTAALLTQTLMGLASAKTNQTKNQQARTGRS
ncbi:MAG: agmatinase [bacterium]